MHSIARPTVGADLTWMRPRSKANCSFRNSVSPVDGAGPGFSRGRRMPDTRFQHCMHRANLQVCKPWVASDAFPVAPETRAPVGQLACPARSHAGLNAVPHSGADPVTARPSRTAVASRKGTGPALIGSQPLARRASRCAWWHARRRGAAARCCGRALRRALLRWPACRCPLLGGPRQRGPSDPPQVHPSVWRGWTCGGIFRDGPVIWLVASAATNPTPPNPPREGRTIPRLRRPQGRNEGSPSERISFQQPEVGSGWSLEDCHAADPFRP